MFNKVIIVGNLTRRISIRHTETGTAIGHTAIATTRKHKDNNGNTHEDMCFIDLVFFGTQAKTANQYLEKGSRILVEGRLKLEQWQDKDGANRQTHKLIVENFKMLDNNRQGGQGESYSSVNDGDTHYDAETIPF